MRLRHLLPIAALALSALTVAPVARAEAPPDVVMLKNGGMLRGTIEELDPQGNVTIVFSSGNRRTVSMSEVNYAGPASGAPSAVAPPPPPSGAPTAGATPTQPLVTVEGEEAHLKLEGIGLTFHRKAGSATASGYANGHAVALRGTFYEVMCATPCDVSLPRGTYDFAVSKDDGSPVETGAVDVTGDGRLEANYVSRSGTRVGGIAIAVVGSVLGGAVMAYGLTREEGGTPFIFAGVGTTLASIVIGTIIAVTSHDKADVMFFPSAPRPVGPHRSDERADSGSRYLGYDPGLSVSMNF